jgi:Uma2 family endonuclease
MALILTDVRKAEIAETDVPDIVPYAGMPITEGELMHLPRDGRKWELEDGRLTEVPTSIKHEEIGMNLILMLGAYSRGRGIITSGQGGFRMTDGNVRAPDVSYTRKERFPGGHAPDTFGDLAPDLCVEIISPSERKAGMARKVREYFDGGAVQVWHVFPERQQVTVFTSPTETQTLDADGVLDAGGVLPGFFCRVADLFVLE